MGSDPRGGKGGGGGDIDGEEELASAVQHGEDTLGDAGLAQVTHLLRLFSGATIISSLFGISFSLATFIVSGDLRWGK